MISVGAESVVKTTIDATQTTHVAGDFVGYQQIDAGGDIVGHKHVNVVTNVHKTGAAAFWETVGGFGSAVHKTGAAAFWEAGIFGSASVNDQKEIEELKADFCSAEASDELLMRLIIKQLAKCGVEVVSSRNAAIMKCRAATCHEAIEIVSKKPTPV